MGILIEYILKE